MKESNFPVMTLAQIELQAASLNCEVVVAKDNELQFDLDGPEAFARFEMYFHTKLLPRWNSLNDFRQWNSKSGNTHAVVELPQPLTVPERIAIQAAGGSDPGREFAALACWWDGSQNPILLFKPLSKGLITEAGHDDATRQEDR